MSKATGKGSRFRSLIMALGILCMAVAVYSVIEVNRQTKSDQTNIQSIVNLRVQALGITKLADDASAATEEAFDALKDLTANMD